MDEPKKELAKTRESLLGSTTDEDSCGTAPEVPKKRRKYRRVKRQKLANEIRDIEGVQTLTLSLATQKFLQCVVGEHVTSENPWKYVSKDDLADNLEFHPESSEFLPIMETILKYPRKEILLVYTSDEAKDYDEFYICTTVKAEEEAADMIANIQQQREIRLNNSVFKTPHKWPSLGSEIEVEELQEKNNRPLVEIELETEYPIMAVKNMFRYRLVEHAIDGYTNLLAVRQTFSNLERKRIDSAIQVSPAFGESESQTVYTFPKNMHTQYHFKCDSSSPPSKEFNNNMKTFLEERWNSISDVLYVNSHINFYANDYKNLLKNYKFKDASELITPHASFSDPPTCRRKEISCHSWHRLYTGIFATAYADTKPGDYKYPDATVDEVLRAIFDVIPVLFWSFQDTLQPKLLLETQREVTALAFCPYDENILVGGCVNGQIIVWDITNKLKGVEEVEILNDDQRRYRTVTKSLTKWMKVTYSPRIVQTTIVSDLEYSHKSSVTSVEWLSPFQGINKCGKVENLPKDEEKLSYQFVTAGKDGAIMVWDLKSKPATSASYKPKKKLRRLDKRPEALTLDVSPLRVLNRLLRPSFKIIVCAPNTVLPLPLTELDFGTPPLTYIEKNPKRDCKFNVTERLVFRPDLENVTCPSTNKFFAGTDQGDFLIGTWEGYDYNAGEIVNKENAKLVNYGKYHDGPILAVSKSSIFQDLILTVGGRVFAIWKTGFMNRPIMWRRNKTRFVHGTWNILRPGLFRLIRSDGLYEIWNLRIRSHICVKRKILSGFSIGGSSLHPFNLKQNIIGLVDGKGTFRTFYISKEYDTPVQEDVDFMYSFCNREIQRKLNFIKWQEGWAVKNSELIEERKRRHNIKEQEKAERLQQEKEAAAAKDEEVKKKQVEKTGQFYEQSQEEWLQQERDHIKEVLLQKKAFDVDVLKKQQIPLLKAEEELRLKTQKQRERLSNAQKIFDESVARLFPDILEKKLPPLPDPYAGGDATEVKISHYENYKETTDVCQEYVEKRKYTYTFDWSKVLGIGRERRKALDGYYSRYSHKFRIINEKKRKESEERERTAVKPQPIVKRSLGSIDYEIVDEKEEEEEDEELSVLE